MMNPSKLFLTFLLLALLLVTLEIRAADPNSLTTVTVSVMDRSQQALNQVMAPAMGQALIKLSGDPNISANPRMSVILAAAQQYLLSYSYYQKQDSLGQVQLWLTLVFDQQALQQLLQQAGQKVWSAQSMPQTLIWATTTNGMAISDPAIDHALRRALSKQAKQHGITVLFPEMDLEDSSLEGPDQNTLLTDQAMHQLAERYGVAAVLVTNLQRSSDGSWSSQWKLLWQGQSSQWQQQNSKITSAALAGIGHLANQFNAAQNNSNVLLTAPSTDAAVNQYAVTVKISGVSDLHDYTDVVNYLRHSSIVTRVDVSHMDNDNLVLQVQALGGKAALIDVLATSPRLEPLFQGSKVSELHYEWRKFPAKKTTNNQTPSVPLHFIDDNI